MKKADKKVATTTSFFDDPAIRAITNNPKRRINILKKMQYLECLKDIKTLRTQIGISQNKLAEIAKISQEEISRIERGQRNITFETYFGIIGCLGYKPKISYEKIMEIHPLKKVIKTEKSAVI